MTFYLLELRPTTFATPPLSKGWGHQPSKTEQLKIDSRLETRLVSKQTLSCFILFNKLLVYPIYDYQFWSFDTSEHYFFKSIIINL
jgi:hypothetical protein